MNQLKFVFLILGIILIGLGYASLRGLVKNPAPEDAAIQGLVVGFALVAAFFASILIG